MASLEVLHLLFSIEEDLLFESEGLVCRGLHQGSGVRRSWLVDLPCTWLSLTLVPQDLTQRRDLTLRNLLSAHCKWKVLIPR